MPYLLDGMRAYEEGVGSVGEIDEAMKAGAGHPMGPLTLSDFVGLDTLGSICDVLFDEFRERRFARPPVLRKMLSAGWYGRKSGMGFYDYSGESPPPRTRGSDGRVRIVMRVVSQPAGGVAVRTPGRAEGTARGDLRAARDRALAGGPERHREKAREQGKLPVRERIALLLDEGSFAEEGLLGQLAARRGWAPTAW